MAFPGAWPRTGSTVAAVLAGAGFVVVAFAAVLWPYTVDDAFVAPRYGRHLVQGLGLSFNPGEPAGSFTSPGWVLLAAGAWAAGLDPVPVLKGVGVAAALACLPIAYRLARVAIGPDQPGPGGGRGQREEGAHRHAGSAGEPVPRPTGSRLPSRASKAYGRRGSPWPPPTDRASPAALLAPVLLATSGPFLAWTGAGLETLAAALAVTLAALRALRGSGGRAGAMLAVGALLRPELPILAPAFVVRLRAHAGPGGTARFLAAFLLPCLAAAGARRLATGSWLPAAVAWKLGGSHDAPAIVPFLAGIGPALLLIALGALAARLAPGAGSVESVGEPASGADPCQLPPGEASCQLPPGAAACQLPLGATACQLPPGAVACQFPPGATACQLAPRAGSCQLPPGAAVRGTSPECTKARSDGAHAAVRFLAMLIVLQAVAVGGAQLRVEGTIATMADHDRYFVPILPVLAAAFAAAIARWPRAARGTIAGLLVAWNLARPGAGPWAVVRESLARARLVTPAAAAVGDWLARELSPSGAVALGDVGLPSHRFPGRIVDLFALHEVALRLPPAERAARVLAAAPDAVVLVVREREEDGDRSPSDGPVETRGGAALEAYHRVEREVLASPAFARDYRLAARFRVPGNPWGYAVYRRRVS